MLLVLPVLVIPMLQAAQVVDPDPTHAFADELARAIELGRKGMLEHMQGSGLAPGCAVAVAIGERVVWEEGFGLANLECDSPVDGSTRFGIGSLSKVLTVACVARMAQDGTLDLDAPVERYLPGFPFAGEGITLRRLAAHQSGLTDGVTASFADTNRNFATITEAYDLVVAGEHLSSPPGTEVAYSNGPYTIIARVMEAATEASYRELMQAYVLDPAGMRLTAPNDRRRLIPGRTGFYHMLSKGRFENATANDPSIKLPAAGWLSTAGDLARFGAALSAGNLLTGEARDDFFTTVPMADGTPTEYALGLRYTEDEGRPVWHLPGGGHGISCWLLLYPEQQVTIAILSNCNQGPVGGPVMGVLTTNFVRVAELTH